MKKRIFVAATNNKGKLPELAAALERLGYGVISLSEAGLDIDPEETGTTFSENAEIKARAVFNACGLPTIADDSGLQVDALGGRPGVFSARYAAPELRNQKLLSELSGVAPPQRTARFVSSICCILADGSVITAEGICPGRIANAESGVNGFGFDPVFIPDGYEQTFGALDPEIKRRISHRAAAINCLASRLKGRLV